MSESEAHQDKYRIGRPEPSDRQAGDNASMPEALCDLIVETDTLYARIARLDGDLFNTSSAGSVEGDAKGQMAALAKAFEGL